MVVDDLNATPGSGPDADAPPAVISAQIPDTIRQEPLGALLRKRGRR
jgi:hypothetical protein